MYRGWPGRFIERFARPVTITVSSIQGRWRTERWSTPIVDVGAGHLIDAVQGRDAGSATTRRWRTQIAEWYRSRASNGPVEATNCLTKRVKRVAFGTTNWTQ